MGWTIWGSKNRHLQEIFSSPRRPDRLRAPPSLFNGYRHLFSRVKRPEREAYHSSPSFAKVKNEWSCTSAPLVCHDSLDRENFVFFFFPHSDVFKFLLFCCPNDWLAKSRNFITNRWSFSSLDILLHWPHDCHFLYVLPKFNVYLLKFDRLLLFEDF